MPITLRPMKPATRLVRGGRRKEWTGAVVNPPVWRASTHLYESDAQRREAGKSNTDGQFFYGRRGSPTQWALAEALTQLEPGAHGTVLYPSGVAAIAGCLLAVLKPGDRLLMADNAYDPSRSMATGLLARMGVTTTFFDPRDPEAFRAQFAEPAQAVWLEAPGSLTFEMCDVPALAAIAHGRGLAVHGPVAQGALLGDLGIAARAEALKQGKPAHEAGAVTAAVLRLTAPQQMGAIFRAVGVTAPGWPVPRRHCWAGLQ